MSRSSGLVTHVLLTRSRLCPRPKPGSSLHLHVLSTPPAFVLSQDQTLREELHVARARSPNRHEKLSVLCGVPRYTRDTRPDGFILRSAGPAKGSGGSNLDAHPISRDQGAHAVEFSKTVAPCSGSAASCESRVVGGRRSAIRVGPGSIARIRREAQELRDESLASGPARRHCSTPVAVSGPCADPTPRLGLGHRSGPSCRGGG